MSFNYYSPDNKDLGTYVDFKLFDKNGMLISDHPDRQCFFEINYGAIPSRTHKIVIGRNINRIPYDAKIIELWIKELNELGFPCQVEVKKKFVYFSILLDDFTYKAHLMCTLSLIRCLFEDYICIVPERYFNILAGDKSIDKFIALQDAHRNLGDGFNYANTNHMVTYRVNGNNVTKEELFERIKNTGYNVFTSQRIALSALWFAPAKKA